MPSTQIVANSRTRLDVARRTRPALNSDGTGVTASADVLVIDGGPAGSYRREFGWSEQPPLAGPRRSTQHLMTRELLPIGGASERGSQ
jgi:hypothetical protein